MKNNKPNLSKIFGLGFLCLSLAINACVPENEAPKATSGSADFSTYVAIGNSLTAGFADNALYKRGQQTSYAVLMAQQMQEVGRTSPFNIPFVNDISGDIGIGPAGNSKLVLGTTTSCNGVAGLGPTPAAIAGDATNFAGGLFAAKGPFHLIGVPGATVQTALFAGFGNPQNGFNGFNPYFFRMAKDPATSSMISDAVDLNPTFFSYFLGNNDVLGYATSGGLAFITPLPLFQGAVTLAINRLKANGAKGVIGNIPDVTSIPYFNTVPNDLIFLNEQQANNLNTVYATPIAAGAVKPYRAGRNPMIIEDNSVPIFGFRSAVPGDLVCLVFPRDSMECFGLGIQRPVPSQYILDTAEVKIARNATIGYNNFLKSFAESQDLAFVDVNAFLTKAKTGIRFDGMSVSTAFVSGGAFSLDGVHLTPLGNALLANEFIKAINAKYGSNIGTVSPSLYEGVKFP